jgi:FMN-dependent oxidoreductase (nitrilotriacetate monooxygenase family)
MMHLAWFVGRGFSVHGWPNPVWGDDPVSWTDPDIYLTLARALDRACLDYVMIEDGSLVPDAYQGSHDAYLRHAVSAPKADPMPLVPLMAQVTRGLGIIATMTTATYPPYLGARLAATLDHLTHGRVGINLVTAHNDRTAQNFGLDEQIEHDLRYEMASEWVEIVDRLWRSWESGAIVADRDRRVFADGSKVHPIDFKGQFYRCRGPLNLPAGPQGRPVICQAGGSPAGRAFAAKHADTVIALVRDVAEAKAYRADISSRLEACGRTATDCKVMFCASVTLGESVGEARERWQRRADALAGDLEPRLAALSFFGATDLSTIDPDASLETISTNASRTMVQAWTARARTLRDVATNPDVDGVPFLGTPESVARDMAEAMEEIGGDGFAFTAPMTRRSITEIANGLVPALQRLEVVRRAYSAATLRETLMEF